LLAFLTRLAHSFALPRRAGNALGHRSLTSKKATASSNLDSGKANVFVHISAVMDPAGMTMLAKGQRLLFDLASDRTPKAVAETLYKDETIRSFLEKLLSIKKTIEIDPEYLTFLTLSNANSDTRLKSSSPTRAMHEIESYVAEKFGGPK
jgi:cold shock CspA family protein